MDKAAMKKVFAADHLPICDYEVVLTQEKDFRFAISFGADLPVLYGDEGPPLGGGT